MSGSPHTTGPVVVDALGGDHAPASVVAGAVRARSEGIEVVLVGDADWLTPRVEGHGIGVIHATERIEMGASALAEVRRKPDSSIRRSLDEVAAGRACAMVSCGHSGAVFLEAMRTLERLPGVDRAALAAALPRVDGREPLIMLDIGANVDCRPEHLAGFADLGAAWAATFGVERPRIGVLSNGTEATKGNHQVRETLLALAQTSHRVVGQVEPGPAFQGACDVLVADGFVGNVALKAMEAAAETVIRLVAQELQDHPQALERVADRVAWARHGGALLLGVRGVAVVGHGRARSEAVAAAIRLAHRAAADGLVERLAGALGP